MKKLILLALACAAIPPAAQAQTGRIAHFSHGGRPVALATAAVRKDNFGVVAEFKADSVRYLSAKTLVLYGHWGYSGYSQSPRTDTLALDSALDASGALRYLRENRYLLRHDNKPVKFVGFDSVSTPAPLLVPQQEPLRKHRRRKADSLGYWPGMPPGTGPAALLLAALAGAGWLLAGRRPVAPA